MSFFIKNEMKKRNYFSDIEDRNENSFSVPP